MCRRRCLELSRELSRIHPLAEVLQTVELQQLLAQLPPCLLALRLARRHRGGGGGGGGGSGGSGIAGGGMGGGSTGGGGGSVQVLDKAASSRRVAALKLELQCTGARACLEACDPAEGAVLPHLEPDRADGGKGMTHLPQMGGGRVGLR